MPITIEYHARLFMSIIDGKRPHENRLKRSYEQLIARKQKMKTIQHEMYGVPKNQEKV